MPTRMAYATDLTDEQRELLGSPCIVNDDIPRPEPGDVSLLGRALPALEVPAPTKRRRQGQ